MQNSTGNCNSIQYDTVPDSIIWYLIPMHKIRREKGQEGNG